ncbi:MAG: glycosyltransferase family 2 protein [Planctomycetes bacterium]|nr:glycosyltransferase family 2 protein [Planctomycetota bacterium]
MADRAAEPAARARTAALLLNWRKPQLTLQCLADLLVVDVPLCVLVIDNGSGDGSAAALREGIVGLAAAHPRHEVVFAALPDNLGFTGGMNHGLRWAAQRGLAYTLVLNNDLRLPPDFLQPLVLVLDHDPRVVAVGPTVLHPDGTVWAEGGELAFGPNALRLCRHGRPPRPREHGPEAVPFLPGACVLLRTDAAMAIGGFDDRYFMYWEDVDICDRLRERGGRIVWLPWVRVVHDAGKSSGGGRSPLRKFLMANNAVRYLRRRGTVAGWAALLLFDVLLWPLTLPAGPRAAWAKLRGLGKGLLGHRAGTADVQRYLPG